MKGVFITAIFFLLFIPCLAFGDQWYPPNQATLQWDRVTTDVDGNTIDLTQYVVRYSLWLKDDKSGEEAEQTTVPIDPAQYTFTFIKAAKFRLGAQAVLFDKATGDELSRSTISYSDDPEVCLNGQIFGVNSHRPPQKPKNLASSGG